MAVGYNDMIVPADNVVVLLYTKRLIPDISFEKHVFKDLFLPV